MTGWSSPRFSMSTARPAQPKPATHGTKVRHRHRLWVASCSCGWSEDTVSRFSAWMASQRHLDETQG